MTLATAKDCGRVILIECNHGWHCHSFLIETEEGKVSVNFCQDCYDRLKGQILQDVINEAACKVAQIFPMKMQR